MKKTNTNLPFGEKLVTQFKGFYEGLDDAHRRILLGAIGLTIAGMVGVGFWASHTPYASLASGGSYDELVASTASLEELGIPYRMTAAGTGLEVPAHMLGRARMVVEGGQLGEEDPEGALPAMLTDKQQRHAFLRMKERSLARMINQIAPVTGSLVTVAPEEESLFLGEKRPATASVLVKLKPGANLSSEQIRSVVTIVAGGVEGLEPEGVTLTDDRGNLLYAGDQKRDGVLASAGLLEHRVAMQRLYEGAIQANLMKLLGSPTDFTVSVSVELDTSTAEIQTRKIDTESPALISESVEESATERTAPGGGVPGTDANLPERAEARNVRLSGSPPGSRSSSASASAA